MTAPRLKLRLLGPPRLELDGRPVQADTRKATALAAYLAVTGEPHSREALAALLWPEADSGHALAALRRTLSALNSAVAGVGLAIDRETVRIEPTAVWVDVVAFRAQQADRLSHGHGPADVCPACLAPLAHAADLYRDDFLAGFSLRDSAAFDDWQFFQAEALRQELAGVLEKLVRGFSAQDDLEKAIAYAQRWLALDRLHEPAHSALMRLYAAAGQRAAALRQYQECARVLDSELGVGPLPETTQLFVAIRDHQFTPRQAGVPVSAPPAPAPAASPPAPLVGRQAEWDELARRYVAPSPDGHWVVIEGEAGIGKTRLAEAWLGHVRAGGTVGLEARCFEGEANLAFSPFIDALRAGVAQPGAASRISALPASTRAEAARLLPELAQAGAAAPLDRPVAAAARSRFFEALADTLGLLLHGPRPGVLFVDDLQWADESSLELLAYLVRRLPGRPYWLLTTWRDDQVPDPLRQLYRETVRAGRVSRLHLPRLDQPAVGELVAAALQPRAAGARHPDVARLTERLLRESEGVPLLVVEYLAALPAEADLAAGWPLPASARELFASRLAAVDEAGQQLLSSAAVIGRSFDFDTLVAASGRSEEEAAAGLDRLVGLGLIREVRGLAAASAEALAYDFTHEKLRTLAYDQIGQARRRLLHRRVAEALARLARESGRVRQGELSGQIAEHYRLGGLPAEAAGYYQLAGDHARALYANTEALAHYRAALATGHPSPAALHEAIGDVLTLTGDYVGALASYARAAQGDQPAGPADLEGTVSPRLEHKTGLVHLRRGDWELAETRFAAALAGLGDTPHAGFHSRIFADWSLAAYQRGERQLALERAERALWLAEAARDDRALAQAHNILGVLHSGQPALAQGRYHLEQSLALAERLGDAAARVAALNNLALAAQRSGDLAEALALTERALAMCTRLGDRHREAALHNNLADLLHAAGRTEDAMAHLKRAVTLFAEIGGEAGDWQPEIWKLTEW